ncbi:MAG: DUF695 domain-containing protein [Myxococcota bacterium]
MTQQEIPEAWETYPAFVDGKPAMFFLNMGLVQAAPIAGAPMLYLVKVQMKDPGENGVGTVAEGEAFMPIEDALCEAATKAGYYFAGRVRSEGHWELGFYGAEGLEISEVLDQVGAPLADLQIMVGGGEDPEWGFLLEYLAPDRERWQWIMDHRVVRQLMEAGDDIEKPRMVDHALHFKTEKALDAFVAAAAEQGFKESQRSEDKENGGERPWMVELQREDAVEVNTIHDAVMMLMELADAQDGDYDGWGCPVAQ